jgi:protocatechuate 3,4-dioxygenase beta subunit
LTPYSRRQALGLIGAAGAALLPLGRGARAQGRSSPACVVSPAQIEGPYFVEEQLERADIRSDPKSGAAKTGVPLRLSFVVSRVGASTCVPLPGAHVDVWHCDAAGAYSDVRDRAFDTRGQQFLRGYQRTDANGAVTFETIYPGWYPGRSVHIHFKVRSTASGGRVHEFTSQIYFDDAVSDAVYAAAPYAGRGKRDTRNGDDFIYARQGGRQLTVPLAKEAAGYSGTFDIGLAI